VRAYATIKERTATLFINVAVAYAVFVWSTDSFAPFGSTESAWLMSAIAFWFLSLLTAPWFLPPRDVIASGVSASLLLITMDLSGGGAFREGLETLRSAFVVFFICGIFLATLALFLHDKNERSPVGRLSFRLASIFGRGEILFSSTAVVSILSAYQASLDKMGWLLVFWTIFVLNKPIERIAEAWRLLKEEKAQSDEHSIVGMLDRIDHPNIVRVRLTAAPSWQPQRLFTVNLPDGTQQYVVSLFSQMQGSEVVGTGLCVATANDHIDLPSGAVCASHDNEKTAEFISALSGSSDAGLVGFVVENSTISTVAFEVAASAELREGDVVFVRISGFDVFYQIIEAQTVEESFDQNPRGTHVVRAAQLGKYSPSDGFLKYPWLPAMNSPMFSATTKIFEPPLVGAREFRIGNVPSTNIDVVARLDELIEYHTAVLGVTGTGKTELVLDVIREAVTRESKVFCVDFTGDYRHRLSDLNPIFPGPSITEARDLEQKLFDAETGEYGAKAEKKALKVGIDKLRASTEIQIDKFLKDDKANLAIFEPADITNTKASLRLTELYLSTIMDWCRKNRRARQVLIVLEEAHTIVPEVFGSGFDADTQFVVSRIGQIALQGRKYRVGLLLVSQRTALVSKTHPVSVQYFPHTQPY